MPSSSTEPEGAGSIASATIPPMATSVSPADAAFSRSTSIAMNGCFSDRLLDGLLREVEAFHRGQDVVGRGVEGLLVGRRDLDLDVARREPATGAARDRDLADLVSVESVDRLLHVGAHLVLIRVGVGRDREGRRAAAAEDGGERACRRSIRSTPGPSRRRRPPRRRPRAAAAASSLASRLVPGGRVWVTESVFWPLLPTKLVGTNGMSARVPTSTSAAAPIVIAGCRTVQLMTGR